MSLIAAALIRKTTMNHGSKYLSQPLGHKGVEATEATRLFPGAQSSEQRGQHEDNTKKVAV